MTHKTLFTPRIWHKTSMVTQLNTLDISSVLPPGVKIDIWGDNITQRQFFQFKKKYKLDIHMTILLVVYNVVALIADSGSRRNVQHAILVSSIGKHHIVKIYYT